MKAGKKEARASVVIRELFRLRDRLRKEIPALRRIEVDVEFEDGKLSQRIKLELKA